MGRFYITRELGRGAIGCVYLGQDPVVGREIAIKTLNPRLAASERARYVNHLINEARAAGRLSHPHIVTIYDASGEGSAPYIAMEYLQGRELHRILEGGHRYAPDEAASIGWKLADALDHAHAKGVVHRDIKPSNIFMVQDDHPKLMDFGIARAPNRLAGEEENDSYTMFRANSPLGTPNYMSPEQAQGKPADERSDIYSLGAVLYEMLAGRKPFEEADAEKLLQQIAHKAPPPLHEFNPDVPPVLAEIVLKAMSKRPDKRYQNAQQMTLELKRYLVRARRARERASQPAAADGATPAMKKAVGPARQRYWMLGGPAIAAVAIVVAVFAL